MENTPWVEKYRPQVFEEIVLNDTNKRILVEIMKQDRIPNLLLYGPPGTGKTTTIINLINKYQMINKCSHKEFIIHLNASDERGISTIRNQIYQFVQSNSLFYKGQKFVILDEVDYMTTNAQQALKNLVRKYNKNVCYCLICNYITKLEKHLQEDFIMLRFNQLPKENIMLYLKYVCDSEGIDASKTTLRNIVDYFNFDIRSMVNYLQSNSNDIENIRVITDSLFEEVLTYITTSVSIQEIKHYIYGIMIHSNCNIEEFVSMFCEYIIKNNILDTDRAYTSIKYIYKNNSEYTLPYLIYIIKGSSFNACSLE